MSTGLAVALALAPSRLAAQDLWTFLGVGVDLSPRTTVMLTGMALSDVHYRAGLLEVRRRVAPWLVITPALLLGGGSIEGGNLFEHRERLDLSLQARTGRLHLTGRTLVERRNLRVITDDRITRSTIDLLRLRTRLQFAHPIVSPFVMAEPFYDLDQGRHARTWLMVGLSLPAHRITIEPYYLRRVEKGGATADAVVVSAIWRP